MPKRPTPHQHDPLTSQVLTREQWQWARRYWPLWRVVRPGSRPRNCTCPAMLAASEIASGASQQASEPRSHIPSGSRLLVCDRSGMLVAPCTVLDWFCGADWLGNGDADSGQKDNDQEGNDRERLRYVIWREPHELNQTETVLPAQLRPLWWLQGEPREIRT